MQLSGAAAAAMITPAGPAAGPGGSKPSVLITVNLTNTGGSVALAVRLKLKAGDNRLLLPRVCFVFLA